MATPSYTRSLMSSFKRLRLSPTSPIVQRQIRAVSQSTRDAAPTAPATNSASSHPKTPPPSLEQELNRIRLPKAVQATYLNPLRRAITHDIPACDLQLRSYSVRNLEVFADFALRAAYFLRMPAKGPVPLRRITERWTVPRSNFVHKKSQENFERVTARRWIRVVDAHPDTVAVWLAFLRKHAYYGVGVKANVYEHGDLDVGAELDREQAAIAAKLGEKLELIGGKPSVVAGNRKMEQKLLDQPFKAAWGASAALGGSQSVPLASRRIESVRVTSDR